MALERQSIEKKDFPIGRRGYEPDAVDAHLRGLADEIDELKRSSRRRSETLASAASDQVRAIVEAAETSAEEIQQQAEEDAREIRAEADSEARARREESESQAREYVGRVSESTTGMLQRIDAMESELGGLLEALRTGANRLNADLQLLEGNIGEVSEAVAPRPRFEPEPEPVAPPPPPPLAATPPPAVASPPPAEPAFVEEVEEVELVETVSTPSPGGEGEEAARLVALNMALNGTPRPETERYLAENFQLTDSRALLDEVYASVEG